MKRILVIAAALAMSTSFALADDKPSADEAKSIEATMTAWGCKGGEYEKETEGTGVFEVDDTTCPDGNQFDAKLDKDFKLISLTRD